MKYLIYAVVMLLGYGLSFGLFPLLLPTWLAIDMVLILVLCIAQCTEDYTASVIGLAIGILVDLFVSPAFGVYTLIYGASGFFYAQISAHLKTDSFITAMLAVFIFYILKDTGLMAYSLIFGSNLDYGYMFIRMTLLSAALNSAVGFIVYLLIVKLHELHCMKIRRELDLLGSYREQTDWLSNWFEQYK